VEQIPGRAGPVQLPQARDEQPRIRDALIGIGIEQALEQGRDRAPKLDPRRLCEHPKAPADGPSIELEQALGPSPRHLPKQPKAQEAANSKAICCGSTLTCQHLGGEEAGGSTAAVTKLTEISEDHTSSWRDDHIVGADITMMGAKPVDGGQGMGETERLGQGALERDRARAKRVALDVARDQPNRALAPVIVDQLERGGEVGRRDGPEDLKGAGDRAPARGRDVLEHDPAAASVRCDPGPALGPVAEAPDVVELGGRYAN